MIDKQTSGCSTKNLDDLLAERGTVAMMKLSERSLSAFLDDEPDLYTIGELESLIVHEDHDHQWVQEVVFEWQKH